MTPTTVGWVLAEGHGADGTILDHNELDLHGGSGVQAVNTAEQVTAEVLRAQTAAHASDHRLRVIGVTWNDEASAQAALVLEALTDAGFDNVVPIRLLDAVETLAQAIVPVIGYEQTAVCILEHDWSTVVMVDTHDGETRTAVKRVRGGLDGLRSWLTGMFERSTWRPAGVVVVGSDNDIHGFSWQLEKALPVPVFAQTMAQVTVARGAALAAASSTEFTDEQLVAETADEPAVAPVHTKRRLSYTGAAAALAAAAVTFVASLSMMVGIELAPDKHSETAKHSVKATPPVAEAGAPRQAPAPAVEPARAPQEQAPADPAPAEEQPPAGASHQPYLTRVLEHVPAGTGAGTNPAPAQP